MKSMIKEFFELKGSKLTMMVIGLLSLIYYIISVRCTIWLSTIVDNVYDHEIVLSYLSIFIIGSVINIIISAVNNRLTRGMTLTENQILNDKMVNKIIDSDYDVFCKYSAGQIQKISQSIWGIAASGKALLNVFNNTVNLIVTIISICIIKFELLFPILIIYGISAIVLRKIWNKLTELDKIADDAAYKRHDEVYKIIQGFAEVRSSNTQQHHKTYAHYLNEQATKAYKKKAKMFSINASTIEIIETLMTLVMIIYAIKAIPNGLASATAMSLIIYSWRLLNPLMAIMDQFDTLSEHSVKYQKYKEFMSIDNQVVNGSIDLKDFESSIEFNNVSFKYESSDNVLENINLKIKKGEKVGICGSSGGGKTTLLKLIPRFYDPTEGSIKIDGIDIKELTFESLRSKLGIVHQSNYIFNGTIYDNITYGIYNATEEAVIEAAKNACIYDFIMSLSEGFNTNVGPNGLKLSGGQQQRIALARIFLKNPDIIILDEATSALDNESEAIVQDSFRMFEGKTFITVAHRLSTIQDSDRIVVIDEHKIAEVGTHDELLSNKGIYHDLYYSKH